MLTSRSHRHDFAQGQWPFPVKGQLLDASGVAALGSLPQWTLPLSSESGCPRPPEKQVQLCAPKPPFTRSWRLGR